MMPDPRQFALSLISQNPTVASNPQAQEYLKVIQNGDSAKGEEIARNLCNTYGINPEDALRQAKSFFHIPF